MTSLYRLAGAHYRAVEHAAGRSAGTALAEQVKDAAADMEEHGYCRVLQSSRAYQMFNKHGRCYVCGNPADCHEF